MAGISRRAARRFQHAHERSGEKNALSLAAFHCMKRRKSMGGFFHGIGEVMGMMFRALIIWALVIAAAAFGWVALESHHLPSSAEWGLVALVALVGGLLGAVSRLAWELTHIGQVAKAVRRASDRSEHHAL